MPAFVNLQQYYVEQYLIEAAAGEPNCEVRFKKPGVRHRARPRTGRQ